MPSIEDLLKAARAKVKYNPVAANAEYLFMNGHLTADEMQRVSKTETVRQMLDETAKPSTTFADINPHIQKAIRCVQTAVEMFVPNSIDYTVIRTSIENKPAIGPNEWVITARFSLLDVKTALKRAFGADFLLDLNMLGASSQMDDMYWQMFGQKVCANVSNIASELMWQIHNDRFEEGKKDGSKHDS